MAVRLHRAGEAGRDGERLLVLSVARVGQEQTAPGVGAVRLNLDQVLVDCRGCRVLLLPGQQAGQSVESLGLRGRMARALRYSLPATSS